MTLPKPKNQRAAVMRMLILSRSGVAERDTNFNGFRSRLSEINRDLKIPFKEVPFTNQFGHRSKYRKHYIPDHKKDKAIKLFMKYNAA